MIDQNVKRALDGGLVIPAHPLALNSERKLDERRQRALSRYYIAAGAGGMAVGVHTTQFEIHDPRVGLLEPVLTLAAEEMNRADPGRQSPLMRIGGICGQTAQAMKEAELLLRLGYHAGLLSLGALAKSSEAELLQHSKTVAEVLPIIGFYLQPAVGGRVLPNSFWRKFVEIPNVLAIKIAPFNRYQTIDVIRAVAETGRSHIALYTGNDDNIVMDLLTPHRFQHQGNVVERRIVGGLLGHWAVWTSKAVQLLEECHKAVLMQKASTDLLRKAIEVTDCNAAFFDAANGFAGCIAGIHEVLRRQGLLEGIWCLDEKQALGPGQAQEIDRVYEAYPDLNDDEFVEANRDRWLK